MTVKQLKAVIGELVEMLPEHRQNRYLSQLKRRFHAGELNCSPVVIQLVNDAIDSCCGEPDEILVGRDDGWLVFEKV